MITLIFSTTNHMLSRFIRWIFKEPCSHFAVCLDDKLVIQSSLLGVVLMWRSDFEKKNKIVLERKIDVPLEDQERIYQDIISVSTAYKYDFPAFFYFGYVALRWKFFGTPIPKHNPWNKKKEYLCTEVAGVLPFKGLENLDLSMITPFKLYGLLCNYKFELRPRI